MTATEDDKRQAALWWKSFRETNNDVFLPLLFDKHRYLVLKGGGGSGKSIFAGRKVLERCTTEPGHRFLVCRKVSRTMRESCFEQLKNQALEHYRDKIKKIPTGKSAEMYLQFSNGSEILFYGLDDAEKLKSIYDITGIWIEEATELEQGDFNQLDIRLRTKFPFYLQMILTFNPVSASHWIKDRFFDRIDKDAAVSETTYKDNRFLIPDAIKVLERYKDTDHYYYMVYCLGQWGVSGKTVFNAEQLSERLKTAGKAKRRGIFSYDYDGLKIAGIEFGADESGPVEVWREPEAGRPYCIGVDTSGNGSDWFVGQVLDNITGDQVAKIRMQCPDEDVFARQLYCLGKHYNNALIGVETNFSTYLTMELGRLGYQNQYIREITDTYTGAVRKAFGFVTNQKTRPMIIAELIAALRDNAKAVESETTIQELLSFVRNTETLRAEADKGCHDDEVMSLAIAWHIRKQGSFTVKKPAEQGKNWTDDQWEDYKKASDKDKMLLRQIWGEPIRR